MTRSGSGGSHGLGCRAQSSRRAAAQMASTRTDRSVTVVPSSVAAASLTSGNGRPTDHHGTGTSRAGSRVSVVAPGRLPPIRAACTPIGLPAPDRT